MANKPQEREIDVFKFKDRLKTILTEREKTQKEVASAINRDPRSFGHYVSGQTVPDIEVLFRLAKHFKTSSDYLIGLSSDSGKKDFMEIQKNKYNTEQNIYDLNGNFRYKTIYTFKDRPASSRAGEIMGILITEHDYDPVYPMNSVLSLDTGYTTIKEDGVYVFEEDGIFKIRKASPIDFSENARLCKVTEDFSSGIEIPKTHKAKGKVIAISRTV